MKVRNFCRLGITFTSDFSVSERNPDGVTFIHARLTSAKILDEGKKKFCRFGKFFLPLQIENVPKTWFYR